jgi:hypothetical protein
VNLLLKLSVNLFWIVTAIFAFALFIVIFYFEEFNLIEKIFCVSATVMYINVIGWHVFKKR